MESIPSIEKQQSNELQAEHLSSPELAIMTCVGPTQYFKDAEGNYDSHFQGLIDHSEHINFHASKEDLDSQGIKNSGEQTYVISSISENPKMSSNFYNCTGVIVVATDSETGKNISFVTHQDPNKLLEHAHKEFTTEFVHSLQTIKEQSAKESIDVVMIGGNYLQSKNSYKKNYLDSVSYLSELVENELGFNPVIASGPKLYGGRDGFVFDTEKRQLYLLRDEDTENRDINHAFTIDDVEMEKERWEKPLNL